MKLFFLFCSFVFLLSCGGGSSSGTASSASVEGLDYSGTYDFAGVQCFSNTTNAATASAAISSGSASFTISGNNYSSTANYGGCTITITRRVVFNADYSFSFTNNLVTSATGGSCSLSVSLSNTPANSVNPKMLTSGYTTGQTFSTTNGAYIRGTTSHALGIYSVFQSSDPTDLCYIVYAKR